MLVLNHRPIHTVIFDMDGLIINNSYIYRLAYQAAARNLSYTIDDDLYNRFLGVPHDVCNQILVTSFGDDFPCADFSVEVDREYELLIKTTPNIFHEGFGPLLAFLQEHQIKLGLATSSTLAKVQFHFHNSSYLDAFDFIATTEDLTCPKPDPEIYHLSLDRLDSSPETTIVLEDSNQGMRAAIAAGCLAIMIPRIDPPAMDVQRSATMILDNLQDLIPQLQTKEKIGAYQS
jgi:beta-phosphoglucomutase-like phosphatase (HAD superfamily)